MRLFLILKNNMGIGFIYELTPRCNLGCGFCYNVWKDGAGAPAELDIEAACRVLSCVLADKQAEWVAFSGGEPLLFQGLDELVQYVCSSFPDIRIGIATNGTLLTKDRASALVDHGVRHFEIPLFAASKKLYCKITGANFLSNVREAIAAARYEGSTLAVATVLTKQNMHELADVIDVAFALGANYLALNRFVPTGAGKKNQAEYFLTLEELSSSLAVADQKARELNFLIYVTIPVEACQISHDLFPNLKFSRCVCGDQKFIIDPAGRLRICEQSADILGDLATQSFAELRTNKLVREFRDFHCFDHCQSCNCYSQCGGGCRFLD